MFVQNTFETGLADETLITAGNSADGTAGTAFDAIGGECRYDDLRAAHGTLSMKGVVDAAEVANIDWSTTLTTVGELYLRAYFYRESVPAAQQRLFRMKNSSNVDTCYVVWHTDGDIYSFNAAGAFYQITTNAPLNEWVRVETRVLANTTTGIVHTKIFQGDSSTVLGENSGSGVNTGADVGGLSMGNCTASNCGNFWQDVLAFGDEGWIGAYSETPAAEKQTYYGYRRRSYR